MARQEICKKNTQKQFLNVKDHLGSSHLIIPSFTSLGRGRCDYVHPICLEHNWTIFLTTSTLSFNILIKAFSWNWTLILESWEQRASNWGSRRCQDEWVFWLDQCSHIQNCVLIFISHHRNLTRWIIRGTQEYFKKNLPDSPQPIICSVVQAKRCFKLTRTQPWWKVWGSL